MIFFRYTPTQADVQVFNEVGKAPAASLPHVLRWYNHISSYSAAERQTFAAGVSPLKAGATTTTAPPAASKEDDDDDVDLFGSGDEEEVCFKFYYLKYLFTQLTHKYPRILKIIIILGCGSSESP